MQAGRRHADPPGRVLEGHTESVHAVTFSPDGERVLSGAVDGTVRLWSARGGRELHCFWGHDDWVHAVAFAPGDRLAASGSADGTARVWDLETLQEILCVEEAGYVNGVCFSPDGYSLLTGSSSGTMSLWDARTGRKIQRFEGHTDWVTGVAFSPDGQRALSGGAELSIRLWDVESGRRIRTIDAWPDEVLVAARHEAPVPAGWDGGGVGLLSRPPAELGIPLYRSRRHTCLTKSVAFSPCGTRVLFCNEESTFRLADLATGRQMRRFHGHRGCVRSVAFSADGRLALSGGISAFGERDNTVRLWEVESGEEIHCFEGHRGWVWSVAFSPDGRRAVSGGGDNVVRIWDLPL